ncbi:MAG: L-fucose/L-arabinose isomerase family protein [Sedimentisphaerales bacterium]|nr:L-fucose/L-arabinose isomerase family protein [Sedimentisphaerales bacterium]
MAKQTFGVIVGNRGFFPDVLAKEGRKDILSVLRANGYGAVALPTTETKYGAVETLAEARKCAELFASKADRIDGIIVTLPNFGDERGIAEAIKRSGLDVPVLIQAEQDVADTMAIDRRRDSFCGKISVCNNLRQAGIPFTLTCSHTVKATSEEFKADLDEFAAVCRIIRGLRHVRFGAIGSRPAAFNTVRYSEKILEFADIAVEPVDLYEILGRVDRLGDKDRAVTTKLNAIKKYTSVESIPADGLLKMAKFGVVVDRWVKENELAGTAIQCWTALEEFFGIVPCTLMSMMSESLMPSACEVDITGLLAMYILQLAGGTPSALLDWNNNFGDDPNKCVLFHCSNLPKSFFKADRMDYQEIIAGSVGKDNTYGTIVGRIKAAPVTFCRTSTDDVEGTLRVYVGEGRFTDDKLETFGGYGVMKIDNLQVLLNYICQMGFEHHVAVNMSETSDAITEALSTYLAWDVYQHS